jgi:type II secretory pathway pseudopilin PulG
MNPALAILGIAIAYLLLLWVIRSERKNAERAEQEDLQDFRDFHIAQTTDWEFPPKWRAPAKEYVAKPKERIR